MYVDPHAADIVFKSSIPLTMVALDVNQKGIFNLRRYRLFLSCNNIHSRLFADILLAIHRERVFYGEKMQLNP